MATLFDSNAIGLKAASSKTSQNHLRLISCVLPGIRAESAPFLEADPLGMYRAFELAATWLPTLAPNSRDRHASPNAGCHARDAQLPASSIGARPCPIAYGTRSYWLPPREARGTRYR